MDDEDTGIGTTALQIRYPREYIKEVKLRDGTCIVLRPIRLDDAHLLQDWFCRLSPQTIYMRFLKSFKSLSDQQAQYFSNVDYCKRMAFVGTIEDAGGERVVAVARYDMLGEHEPGAAESAIVVQDDYQRRGLGTLIMLHLIRYAKNHGVSAFLANIHVSNDNIMNFIKRGGLSFQKKLIEPGVWEVRVPLQELDI